MEIDTQEESLHVIEALASDTRLKIINLLAQNDYNIKDLAKELYMSSAIVSRHITKLEEANIIKTEIVPAKSGSQKMCRLAIDQLYIRFPQKLFPEYDMHKFSIPVGHFTDFNVTPTCGLASADDLIGKIDDPRFFMSTERVNAELLWFTTGFVEYKIPNMLNYQHKPELLEISLEMSSEFPVSNNNWPSDVTFYVNDTKIGTWTVPGNFSDVRGKMTPLWWPRKNSQYGLLKTLRINADETLIDGYPISNINLNDIDFSGSFIKLKFEVAEDAQHPQGLTIFGESFGNHPQNIEYKMYYSVAE